MIQALLGVVGVLVGVIGGYLTARLKTSIKTTEASILWQQSAEMRQELAKRAADLELELARQKKVHDEAIDRLFKQTDASEARCIKRLDEAYEEIRQLKARLDDRG